MPKYINIIMHLKIHTNPHSSLLRKALHVQSRSYWAPANIGPYSQAISIPTNSPLFQELDIWAVSVAGHIPLIPSSMILPLPQTASPGLENIDASLKNFKFQTTLALQHLWRIGRETSVSWWTSAVAYLPNSSTAITKKRALIASQSWSHIHSRNPEDDEEDDEVRDLWEEKNYAGMERRGEMRSQKLLPDWDVVQSSSEGVEINAPPFWAVEVEELPRGSEIEWHAHLGVSGGIVKVRSLVQGCGLLLIFRSLMRLGERVVGSFINVCLGVGCI
jgi:diphthine-ammonia ligase